MNLTQLQKNKIKAHVLANTNTVITPQAPEGIAIKDVPVSVDTYYEVTQWYNATATPGFWVWKGSINRGEIYYKTGPGGTVWVWNTYKAQTITEQNTWVQMFMGDNNVTPVWMLTFREGVFNIFGGSTGVASGQQRVHILSMLRKQARRIEQVLALTVTAVGTGAGQILPDVDNGNVLTDALGAATNPAVGDLDANGNYLEGQITQSELVNAVLTGV